MKTFFMKGKGIGTKNIDSNRISIWVEVAKHNGVILIQKQNDTLKVKIGDLKFDAWIGDSTTPIRATNDDKMIAQIEINMGLQYVGLILVGGEINID